MCMYMYVAMYLYMYCACVHVCMYVCMHVCICTIFFKGIILVYSTFEMYHPAMVYLNTP